MPPKTKPVSLKEHIAQMRAVSPDYDVPLVDPWDPATLATLGSLTEKRGRISGRAGPYRLQYFAGRFLAVEVDILIARTGRRIAQDGSEDVTVLKQLRERLAIQRAHPSATPPPTPRV